jgi:hypothetical protein
VCSPRCRRSAGGLARPRCDAIRDGDEGKNENSGAATASAPAGNADGGAARRGDRKSLPAALLAVACARGRAGRGRRDDRGAAGRGEASLRADRWCGHSQRLVCGCVFLRRRLEADAAHHPGRDRTRDRCPGASGAGAGVPRDPRSAAGRRRAWADRLRGSGAGGGGPAVTAKGHRARARRSRAHDRLPGDADRCRPVDGLRDLLHPPLGGHGRATGVGLPVRPRDLAHTLPRRRAALLRPGGERPDEEERCRPTSCCRP